MCHIINTTTGKSIIQCQYDHKDQASAGYVSNPSSVTDCHIQKCSNDPKDSTGRSRRYSHTSGLYIPPCRQNIPRQSTYEIHNEKLPMSSSRFHSRHYNYNPIIDKMIIPKVKKHTGRSPVVLSSLYQIWNIHGSYFQHEFTIFCHPQKRRAQKYNDIYCCQ